MAYLDRREPGVYVDIQDVSYAEETIETGRSVYSVILCDRGPSDKIVQVQSQAEFHTLFGEPNFLRTSQTHYQVDAALKYTGNVLVTRVVPDDAYWANTAIKENTEGTLVKATFTFTNGLKDVIMQSLDAANYGGAGIYAENDTSSELDKVQVGSWIYADVDNSTVAAQVVNRVVNDDETITLTLDRKYLGSSNVGNAYIFTPFEEISLSDVNDANLFTNPDGNIVFYFYANGAGKYYNKICIRGTRNTDLEKYYIYDDGTPRFKYLFMDIGVYELQDNGNYKLLEGPWVVSLVPRYPGETGQVLNPTTGQYIFIEDVINDNSNIVRCVASTKDPVTEEPNAEFPAVTALVDSEDKRLQVMLMLSTYTPLGTSNIVSSTTGLTLKNGTDGSGQYNSSGNIQPSEELLGKVGNAFSGQLTTNGIDMLREQVYAAYQPDYIVCGGFPAEIQYQANELASWRQDCICLADTGSYYTSSDKDLEAREKLVPWNNFTSMLYTQYRRITDTYTGRKFWISPVYHAIQRHLYCDGVYFLSEPVAGIEKGAIEDPIVLAYKGNHTSRGDFGDVELNCTIEEPDGTYFLTQFTTWKRYSVLKRAHVAKFVCYLKKAIPPILKDLLQRKGTSYWINQAKTRVDSLLNNFLEGPSERYASISKYTSSVSFDESTSTMDVSINIWPLRAIERINVVINVN